MAGAPTASDPELLRDMLAAVLEPAAGKPVAVTEYPFLGLASFDQETAALFHGRQKKRARQVRARLLCLFQ